MPKTNRQGTVRHRAAAHALIFVCALSAVSAAAAQWQPPASIRAAAEQFVRARAAARAGVEIEAIAVDDRLKLPLCSQSLSASSDRGLVNGRGTVTVRCDGARPWHVYVPIRVSELVPVVIVRGALQRDAVLTEENVAIEMRRSATLPYQFVGRVEDAVGYAARYALTPGTVLVPSAIARDKLIARGALVTLVSGVRGIEVSASGVAVEDAGLQQRIRVRTAAGRIVEGVVEAPNRVRVGT